MRVVLLCHAATSAIRAAAFAGDEPLDQAGVARAAELAGTTPRVDQVRRAPSERCRQTAEAMGLDAVPESGLAGCDFGAWTGRTLDDVLGATPDAVTAWLTDPTACPHGGESLSALLERVGRWLDGVAGAVTEQGQAGARAAHGDRPVSDQGGGGARHRRPPPVAVADRRRAAEPDRAHRVTRRWSLRSSAADGQGEVPCRAATHSPTASSTAATWARLGAAGCSASVRAAGRSTRATPGTAAPPRAPRPGCPGRAGPACRPRPGRRGRRRTAHPHRPGCAGGPRRSG